VSGGELRAEVSAVSAAGMEGLPARLVLLETVDLRRHCDQSRRALPGRAGLEASAGAPVSLMSFGSRYQLQRHLT